MKEVFERKRRQFYPRVLSDGDQFRIALADMRKKGSSSFPEEKSLLAIKGSSSLFVRHDKRISNCLLWTYEQGEDYPFPVPVC